MAGGAYGVIRWRQPKPTLIRVAKVDRIETLTSIVTASGEVRAHEMVDIQTEVPGVITGLPVKEGQTVKKGDVLLRIDAFQAETAVASERARFAVAQAEVKRLKSTIETALSNIVRQRELIKSNESELDEVKITLERDQSALKRYQELLKTRAISRDEYETFESKMRISAKRVDMARSTIEQARAQLRANESTVEEQRVMKESAEQGLGIAKATLNRAQDDLSKTTIRSPMNGVIVRLNVDIGERAVPGIQSNPQATLMTIANLATIEAEMKVDETDIVRVALNQQAKITVDALKDTPLKGHVTEISTAPIETVASAAQQEGKDFKVLVQVDAAPKTLRIGMLCEAEITIDTRKNILAIPIQSLTTRESPVDAKGAYLAPPKPEKEGKSIVQAANAKDPAKPGDKAKKNKTKELQGVYVKGPDGFAHFRPVKVGIMGDTNIELLEGLKEGEEVITGPLQSLRTLDEWTLVSVEAGK